MAENEELIKPSQADIQKRYETLVKLYEEQFLIGLDEKYRNSLYLSKELLVPTVNQS